jgi:hypothetical protein
MGFFINANCCVCFFKFNKTIVVSTLSFVVYGQMSHELCNLNLSTEQEN